MTSSHSVAGSKRCIPKVLACGVGREESPEPYRYMRRIPTWKKKLFEDDSEKESD